MAAETNPNYYQPVERHGHTTVQVGDYLYMWGGNQPGLPEVHDSEEKKSICSVVEVCNLATGMWVQKPTTGTPPLGVDGYSAAVIRNEIYFFGGLCHHDKCYHNSLYSFNVDTLNWKELSPTTSHGGPMMKAQSGMIPLHLNGEDYLAVIGGRRQSSVNTPLQPGAEYIDCIYFRCNEIHLYKISSGEWISPTITGDRPPPISAFTLTSITNNSAILFGGYTADGTSDKLYIIEFSRMSVDISEISNPGGSVEWPEGRCAHTSVLINGTSGPHLLVVGGYFAYDSWIYNINKRIWKQLYVPLTVSERCHHSFSMWNVTPTINWAIEFGGCRVGSGWLQISDMIVIELRYAANNDWFTSIIPLDQYQWKLQEKRRELEAFQPVQPEDRREIVHLMDVLQERARELQEQIQLQSRVREYQERERQLRQQLEDAQQREQNFQEQFREQDQLLQERERQIQEGREIEQDLQQQLQQVQERERGLEQQLRERDRQERESSWVVSRNDIRMTERILGRGGWGEVRVARFHGLQVAAKVLHEAIISEYNISLFSREMNIASKIRHPNLLQFIGATTEGNPIILTELMPTSLRKELETGGLAYPAILSISLDVACALNYLHLFKPHPILHRNVSSANVLLQPMGVEWRAKVSDYGSANLQPLIGRTTNSVYSAPEAANPREHSPSMDVFSYGVLLLEMITRRIPLPEERVGLIDGIRRASFRSLVQRCLIVEYRRRPTMSVIITELNETIY
ncbi:PREDICTED: kelch domain-containing protein 4-like [Amphimedon queenslandica]|uniref:Protein kinase domain-containing protein n=1 Tax=Amphimedon queenslandica TaxID=400682 RepID=A0A1X7THT7_AMPQE|nr:PREDICTED: kelch domain-containing protein 4-like [Amphimedon queenslandica]|eukprot:XP_019859495.1 PREDICTED: kelch domain-containing protein 4-like [Amphimedon queenslandica]